MPQKWHIIEDGAPHTLNPTSFGSKMIKNYIEIRKTSSSQSLSCIGSAQETHMHFTPSVQLGLFKISDYTQKQNFFHSPTIPPIPRT